MNAFKADMQVRTFKNFEGEKPIKPTLSTIWISVSDVLLILRCTNIIMSLLGMAFHIISHYSWKDYLSLKAQGQLRKSKDSIKKHVENGSTYITNMWCVRYHWFVISKSRRKLKVKACYFVSVHTNCDFYYYKHLTVNYRSYEYEKKLMQILS